MHDKQSEYRVYDSCIRSHAPQAVLGCHADEPQVDVFEHFRWWLHLLPETTVAILSLCPSLDSSAWCWVLTGQCSLTPHVLTLRLNMPIADDRDEQAC